VNNGIQILQSRDGKSEFRLRMSLV